MVTAETKSPAPVDNSILKQVLPTSDSEPTTYKANCHCGAVRYEVTLKDPFPKYPINKCSCTICTKNGYLLVYPTRSDVVFTRGYDYLAGYRFGTKKKVHKFCKACGSSILIDFMRPEQGIEDPTKDILAVNCRMFVDIDLEDPDLSYTVFDGKNKLEPQYKLDD